MRKNIRVPKAMSLARQAGFNKTAVESFNDNLAVAMAYGFAHFSQLSNLCLRQGCPTCGPWNILCGPGALLKKIVQVTKTIIAIC